MKNFDNIKNLWQSGAEGNLPDAGEIILRIKHIHRKIMRRNIIGAVVLCFTFFYIIFIGWYYHFEKWTTRTGIIIILLAIVMGIVFNTRLIQLLLRRGDLTLDNRAYLEQLIHFRNAQRSIQQKGIALYFILLTIGIGLYMVEFAQRSIYFGIGAYTITFGWIGFGWFYLRKRIARKQEKQINDQIESMQSLMKGIEDE